MTDLQFQSADDLRAHYAKVHSSLRGAPPRKVVSRAAVALPSLPGPRVIRQPRAWLIVAEVPPQPRPDLEDDRPKITGRQIMREVAEKHQITHGELASNRRETRLVIARQEAMYRMKMETSLSYPQMGRLLGGRDHTTVLYGVRKHMARMLAEASEG